MLAHSIQANTIERASRVSVKISQLQGVCATDNLHFPIALLAHDSMSVSRVLFLFPLQIVCMFMSFINTSALFPSLSLSHIHTYFNISRRLGIRKTIHCILENMSKSSHKFGAMEYFVRVLHYP